MAMRVATFASHERMLKVAMTTQARMAELQLQQASGSISTDYSGLGASSKQLFDLEASRKVSQSYSDAASEAVNRIEVMYSTLSSITDVLTDFRAQLTTAMSTDGGETGLASLATTAEGYFEELASLLNTTYEGRYLFSGEATQTAPVDLTGYLADADTASTSYYAGSIDVAAVKISRNQTISYGVTADNTAFEQAFRALSIIADGPALDSETLEQSYALVVSALDAAIEVQSGLSVKSATLERAVERAADQDSMYEAMISQLRDADVTEITVKLTSYETQLEASYAAIAKLQGLSLVDYLS
ncbi:flagellin [Devosia sp. CN2-171]|uniref:flagellin n=1 Tax=Devosia sp. CN2-171 TaxID=3400909 RepID=UPI003BF82A7D